MYVYIYYALRNHVNLLVLVLVHFWGLTFRAMTSIDSTAMLFFDIWWTSNGPPIAVDGPANGGHISFPDAAI